MQPKITKKKTRDQVGLKFYIIPGGCASSRLIHGFSDSAVPPLPLQINDLAKKKYPLSMLTHTHIHAIFGRSVAREVQDQKEKMQLCGVEGLETSPGASGVAVSVALGFCPLGTCGSTLLPIASLRRHELQQTKGNHQLVPVLLGNSKCS